MSELSDCINGHQIVKGAQFCPICGIKVDAWTCSRGHFNQNDFAFCSQCGERRPAQFSTPPVGAQIAGDYLQWAQARTASGQVRAARPTVEELRLMPETDAGARFLAGFIDGVIVLALSFASFGILGLAYLIWAGWYEGVAGQSVGGMAMRTYIVRKEDRMFIGGGAGIGRRILSWLNLFSLGIGYLLGLVTGQSIPDRILHTVVVRRLHSQGSAPSVAAPQPFLPPPPIGYQHRPPERDTSEFDQA